MLEDDIRLLVGRDSDFDLSALQTNVWMKEAHIRVRKAAARRLASWQAVVMVLAVVGSATAGSALATSNAKARDQRTVLDAGGLAPSSLLFGSHL